LLPALNGKVVLDIGCGFGDFCRYAAAQGASRIKRIDPSANMVGDAEKNTPDKNIEYVCIPVELFCLDKDQYDVIVSSVAFLGWRSSQSFNLKTPRLATPSFWLDNHAIFQIAAKLIFTRKKLITCTPVPTKEM
jgi:SAM-dependent methyltransferase